ncbi:cupin domain-containing protein [Streptomyces sp. SID3343]|uniref:cupin domain-containing protein n=1 Tax=Streptomyces sp. SID3343 TaxID=2690260 RepID=UPI001370A870|nr:cupin domain-containing protein [Streptomyces sp. SID3343]MYW06675.1 cupin domain-containing protein [Streptomyces sp. SID3343]
MTTQTVRIVDLEEIEPNRRRGGDLRVMLSPATVGSTSGFMGLAIIQPGDMISEHYHPYSEEFIHVVSGTVEVDLDGVTHEVRAEQGLMIPRDMRHRFRNVGSVEARMVFQLAPLAPRPELGHVDTEDVRDSCAQHPRVEPTQSVGAES